MVKDASKIYNGLDSVIINSATTQESLVSKENKNFPEFENTLYLYGKKH